MRQLWLKKDDSHYGKPSLAFAPLNEFVTCGGHELYGEDQGQLYPPSGWYTAEDIAEGYPDLSETPPMQAIIYNPHETWGQPQDSHLCVVFGWYTESDQTPHGGWDITIFTYNFKDPTYSFSKYPTNYEAAQRWALEIHPQITPDELVALGWDSHGTYPK